MQKNLPKCVRKIFFMHFYLFCLRDLVTCMGEREIQFVSARLEDNPEELV